MHILFDPKFACWWLGVDFGFLKGTKFSGEEIRHVYEEVRFTSQLRLTSEFGLTMLLSQVFFK